ncbi:hypothetical protein CPB84DRAFT_1785219 [Gymnopilus junonius]|uniref:F-box domain-containing protein n=1 Tax=Gymnopilus junonius TaxID=109634 RepID=A0A9P5NK53_GYMJU|nr:hypothetical protein CPB84DRAFT_1785219 [Gymnopilus junonius]
MPSILHMCRPVPPSFLSRPMPQLAFSRRQTGVHSLPIELLTIIFLLGSSFDDPYADGPFLLKPEQEYKPVPSSNFQVVVSHVCRHWRQVALSTSTLWTTLHFRDPTHLHRAKTYLSRCSTSQTYLLDVLVDTVAAEDHVPGLTLYNEELHSIFQIIIPHIKRWRAFHLKISDNECKGTARLFLGTCGGAPNLETLQLYHFENFRTSQRLYLATYRPPVVIFENSLPRLKNISLIGVNLPWENSPYLTKLHQLELALHSEAVRPLYTWWDHFLRSSPDLKVLCLHYSGPKDASPDDSTRAWYPPEKQIPLEMLRELSFTDLDPGFLCELIRRLSLPGLKKLRTIKQEEMTINPSPLIFCLFKVEIIVIHSLECSLASWTGFLRAAQNVRKLKVNFARVGMAYWDVFTQDGDPLTPLGVGIKASQSLVAATGESSNHMGVRGNSSDKSSSTSILLPHLEVFELTGVTGKGIISALRYRHLHRRESTPKRQEWIVSWSGGHRDVELDELIEQGYWAPEGDENVREEDKVIIREAYDDEDEDNDEEEDEDLEAVDSDEESSEE